MSTEVISMQSLQYHSPYEAQPNWDMLGDMSQLYATPYAWGTILPTNNVPSAADYMNFPTPSIPSQTDSDFAFNPFGSSPQQTASAQALSQPDFEAGNAMAYNQSVSGLSTAQASSRPVESSPISRNNSILELSYFDGTQNNAQYADTTVEPAGAPFPKKPRKVGRKRKMEQAEPGSERAIYLEKNRQAASKCRNKQRKQQEDLVEQAREVQTRNKCLKAEVELLRRELRIYMDHAGHHSQCTDSRLAAYLQREADRLASGFRRNSASPHTPNSSIHTSFSPSIESTSEDRAVWID